MNRTEIINNPMFVLYLFIGLACLTALIILVSWLVEKYNKYKEKKRFNHYNSFIWNP